MSIIPAASSLLTGNFLWKAGAIAGGLVVLVLSALLIAAQIDTNRLKGQISAMDKQINDPTTGYVVRLAQARTNVTQLETQIRTVRVQLQTQAQENARVLEQTRRQVVAAQQEAATERRRVQEFLRRPPQGNTELERMQDIDRRILQELNHE